MNNMVEFKNIDLNNVQERFIDYLDVNELTVKNYKEGIKHFIDYLEENNIKQPTRIDFRNFRDSLKDKMQTNTINSYLTANRGFFRYLEANGIYPNITNDVKSIRTSNIPKKQVLSQEECKNIYNSLTDKREKLMFSLAITTGLRANEIALAKIENIKLYNDEIVLFVKCKKRDDETEYVKLSDQVLKDIEEYIEQRTDGYIFISTSNHNNGGGVTSKTIRLIVKSILKRFGYDEDYFSCHSLRRSFATISYNNGADVKSIQQVLHHRSLATTNRYINQCTRDNNKLEYKVADAILS